MRAALGVTRARLVRQLLTESVLLSAVGALLGLLPAWAAVRLIATAGPSELPRLASLSLDARAVAVAVLLAMASGVLFGLAPLRQLTRRDAADELRGAGRRTGGVAMWRARAVLVAGNVAMAAVLLAGSGVLVRSITRLLAVEPGFRPDGVLTMRLWAGGERFSRGRDAAADRHGGGLLRRRADARAGAARRDLGLVGHDPAAGRRHRRLRLPRRRAADRQSRRCALGRPLRRDRPTTSPRWASRCCAAGCIDAPRWIAGASGWRSSTARRPTRCSPGDDPIGRQVMIGPPTAPPRTIVGIVGDVRHQGPRSSAGAAGLRAAGAVGVGRDADDAGGAHDRRVRWRWPAPCAAWCATSIRRNR